MKKILSFVIILLFTVSVNAQFSSQNKVREWASGDIDGVIVATGTYSDYSGDGQVCVLEIVSSRNSISAITLYIDNGNAEYGREYMMQFVGETTGKTVNIKKGQYRYNIADFIGLAKTNDKIEVNVSEIGMFSTFKAEFHLTDCKTYALFYEKQIKPYQKY